ncbi:hypothetical protein Pelo_5847 [Pelomyxa schiedti]|nr:hypothetical protein Pelo_5847 [Pelomyxa schiedti]
MAAHTVSVSPARITYLTRTDEPSIEVTNHGTTAVAVKVKTAAPGRYTASPPRAVLLAGQTVKFTVGLSASEEEFKKLSGDSIFFVWTPMNDPSEDVQKLWAATKNPPMEGVQVLFRKSMLVSVVDNPPPTMMTMSAVNNMSSSSSAAGEDPFAVLSAQLVSLTEENERLKAALNEASSKALSEPKLSTEQHSLVAEENSQLKATLTEQAAEFNKMKETLTQRDQELLAEKAQHTIETLKNTKVIKVLCAVLGIALVLLFLIAFIPSNH